mmetsp:Transcript_11757/g.27433  ORF Transcript_11757/g.27433 Transcript_11757/m.27433 type:complete len:209 (+) Transcript_11757:516-1142(+)
MGFIVLGQLAGLVEAPADLQEAVAHQRRAQRDGGVDDPGRPFQVGRGRPFEHVVAGLADQLQEGIVGAVVPHEGAAHHRDDAGEEGAGQQAEDHETAAVPGAHAVDHHIDPDVDAGPHAIGRTELAHPDEQDDAELLRPAHVDLQRDVLDIGQAGEIAVHDGDKDHQRGRGHQEGDQPLLEMIQQFVEHGASDLRRHSPARELSSDSR